jgi:hypothetical protein
MAQSSVSKNQGFGVVGELFSNGPVRTQPFKLVSTPAVNTIGTAFTVTAEGVATAGGDAGIFAGILVNPKHYASGGTSAGGTLAATLALPDNTTAELMQMGEIIVSLSNAAVIGSGVYYADTTGVLGCGTASTGQTQITGAEVTRFATSGAGLAVIKLTR